MLATSRKMAGSPGLSLGTGVALWSFGACGSGGKRQKGSVFFGRGMHFPVSGGDGLCPSCLLFFWAVSHLWHAGPRGSHQAVMQAGRQWQERKILTGLEVAGSTGAPGWQAGIGLWPCLVTVAGRARQLAREHSDLEPASVCFLADAQQL